MISLRSFFFALFLFFNLAEVFAQVHVYVGSNSRENAGGASGRTPDELLNDVKKSSTYKIDLVDAVRLLKAKQLRDREGRLSTAVYIHLEKGVYRLTEPIRIDQSSGGSSSSSVSILGPEGGGAVLTGSRLVRDFVSVTGKDRLTNLPEGARGHTLQANVRAQGVSDFGGRRPYGFGHSRSVGGMELFFRGEPMTIARWPNDSYARVGAPSGLDSGSQFRVLGKDFSKWVGGRNVSVFGYWRYFWADETLNVESIDSVSGVVSLEPPGSKYGIKEGQPVFFQNILAELDRPGEWYLDFDSGVVYFWPPALPNEGDVEVSVLESLLVMNGAENINISNLKFQNVRGSAIVVNDGVGIRVSDTEVRNTGSSGVIVRGSNSGVDRMKIVNTGGAGVVLAGGDRARLVPGKLYVTNSSIQHFGRLARAYQPAVDISGVGNSAVGNVISDAPHSAIIFHGNDHLVADNRISRVCLEAGDSGVIYTGRDWTARGSVVSGNVIRDVPLNEGRGGVFGVYLDDQASGIVVRNNKIYKTLVGVFIGGGRDNVVEDNEIYDSGAASVHLDARGLGWQKGMTNDPNGPLRKKLKEFSFKGSPYWDRYPNLATLADDEPGRPKYNVLRRNRFTGSGGVRILEGAQGGFSVIDVMSSQGLK